MAKETNAVNHSEIVSFLWGVADMLTIAEEHIAFGLRKNGEPPRPAINQHAEIHLFGQEVNPET